MPSAAHASRRPCANWNCAVELEFLVGVQERMRLRSRDDVGDVWIDVA